MANIDIRMAECNINDEVNDKTKIDTLKKLSDKHNFTYQHIESTKYLNVIYDLLINDIYPTAIIDNDVFYYYLGIYHGMKMDIDSMLKYYQKSAEMDNMISINYLAWYHYDMQNYEEMFEYTMNLVGAQK